MHFKTIKRRHTRSFKHCLSDGTAPGSLTVHHDLPNTWVQLVVTAFNETELIEQEITDPKAIIPYLEKYPVTWLSVYGLGDLKVLEQISKIFDLHPIAMEDVVNVHQRPKLEEYGTVMFAVTSLPSVCNEELDLEQLSIFWGKNFVITFNERQGNYIAPLRSRIRKGNKRHILSHPEYLAYSIIDNIVDSFFPVLEILGSQLDEIEEDAIANPTSEIMVNIHNFKRELIYIRRAMWSQREAIRYLSENNKHSDEMRFSIRDCEDHTIQLIDILESYRERSSGLMDIYLSAVNNKMNEIMKVLTMIATIFMPIGVIAGIYGMNFDRSVSDWNLPELGWRYGYQFALGLMLTIAVSLLYYFWRKGWLTRRKNLILEE